MKHESSNARRIMRFASGPLAAPVSGSRAENEPFRTRVKMVPITELKPNPNNARTHSAKQIRQIAKSFTAFGVTNPPLVSEDMELITGHGRYEAAKLLGLSEMPVLIIAGLSRAKRRALAIADNKIPENAGWDRERLAMEIPELTELLSPEGLDISILGFDPVEIEQIRIEPEKPGAGSHDEDGSHDDIDATWGRMAAVSRTGDLWNLDPHRLLCGDGRSTSDLERLMGDDRAEVAFIDPPSGMRAEEAQGGLGGTVEAAAAVSREGAVLFACTEWASVGHLAATAKNTGGQMLDVVVWVNPEASQGPMYRVQYGLIGVLQVGPTERLGETRARRRRQVRSNVWRYPGATSLPQTFPEPLRASARLIPMRLVADAIKDCAGRNDVILDPFCGAGATIMAAQKLGRRARCAEREPLLVDVAIRRWQAATGRQALHAESRLPFNAIEARHSRKHDGWER